MTAAFCFIGHGVWGTITKASWLPFFEAMNISESSAWQLMPLVGCFDITLGLLLLWKPRRAILLWMFGWAVFTSLLRPLAGFSLWEVWERAGNFGPPLILLVLGGAMSATRRDWFGRMDLPDLTSERVNQLEFLLRLALALLLLGHGAFGAFMQKAILLEHWASIGIAATPNFLISVGWFEIALAASVLLLRTPGVLWFVLAWKLMTEFLYPISGGPLDVFEFVERAGAYGIPIALLAISRWRAKPKLELIGSEELS
ncbi:MAG: hypothetical protein IH881_18995 [Myxococcales bacterium]|nr:hypothetical protein [Myxococcales bacterium]